MYITNLSVNVVINGDEALVELYPNGDYCVIRSEMDAEDLVYSLDGEIKEFLDAWRNSRHSRNTQT